MGSRFTAAMATEWWRRLSWAFDHSLSTDPDEADFGWVMLDHLARSQLATKADEELFQSVAEQWMNGDNGTVPSEGGRP